MAKSKAERAAVNRAWYARNREREANKARERRRTDPKFATRSRERYWKDPERARAENRRRYAQDPEAHARRAREYRAAEPVRYKRRRRLYKYGLRISDFLELWNLQGGRCAICMERLIDDGSRQTHVDHCHATGRVRGLLCADCNVGLGRFKDNTKALRAAATYLERTE